MFHNCTEISGCVDIPIPDPFAQAAPDHRVYLLPLYLYILKFWELICWYVPLGAAGGAEFAGSILVQYDYIRVKAKSVAQGLDRGSSVAILHSTLISEVTKENDWSLVGGPGFLGLLRVIPVPRDPATNLVQLRNPGFVHVEP